MASETVVASEMAMVLLEQLRSQLVVPYLSVKILEIRQPQWVEELPTAHQEMFQVDQLAGGSLEVDTQDASGYGCAHVVIGVVKMLQHFRGLNPTN